MLQNIWQIELLNIREDKIYMENNLFDSSTILEMYLKKIQEILEEFNYNIGIEYFLSTDEKFKRGYIDGNGVRRNFFIKNSNKLSTKDTFMIGICVYLDDFTMSENTAPIFMHDNKLLEFRIVAFDLYSGLMILHINSNGLIDDSSYCTENNGIELLVEKNSLSFYNEFMNNIKIRLFGKLLNKNCNKINQIFPQYRKCYRNY